MLSFEINGALVNIDLPDDTRLLWVVLDVLNRHAAVANAAFAATGQRLRSLP